MELITAVAAAALIISLLAAVIITTTEISVQQRTNQILDFLNRDDD